MKRFATIVTIFGMAAAGAPAQDTTPPAAAAPAAAAAPTERPSPFATRAPRAAQAPAAPRAAQAPLARPAAPTAPAPAREYQQWRDEYSQDAQEYARQAAEMGLQSAEQAREQAAAMREAAQQAREQAREAMRDFQVDTNLSLGPLNMNFDLGPLQQGQGIGQGIGQGVAPFPTPKIPIQARFGKADSSLYGRGQTALDDHKYDQALDCFSEVVSRGGPKADGALYWKAYTLNKLGRRDDAQAAINQLRTSFPTSHWLEDAKALELEVKQASGKPVSPETEADDDLKLMALNGIAQSDPARAFPLLEKLIKGPASPKLKKNAIYVLAINPAPQAQQLLEQIARGNSNPDLQMTAIEYMLRNKQTPNRPQALFEIYNTTGDPAVKRQIISALRSNGDTDHLMQIYKSEKDQDLRRAAISGLGEQPGNAELWTLYQNETTPEGKMLILSAMTRNTNTEKLAQVARTDSDPKVRARAIEMLASARGANLSDTLTGLYTADQDPQVKRAIINQLAGQRDAKALVNVFHKETNLDMKKSILSNLERMHTAEANELYMEILGK